MRFELNRGRFVEGVTLHSEHYWDTIPRTVGLYQASFHSAMIHGGPIVKGALEKLPNEFLFWGRDVVVDTKIHMLMPGMIPAIPGWHTDGIPRDEKGSPQGKALPFLPSLEKRNMVRYALFLAGGGSRTAFIPDRHVIVDAPDDPSPDLYKEIDQDISEKIEKKELGFKLVDFDKWYFWDWFELHKAMPAEESAWRLLIRVTVGDYLKPRTTDFFRAQEQVYLPLEYGW